MEMKPILIFESVDDTSALSNFYCGLQSMDEFIHDPESGLNSYVRLGLTKLWIVKSDDEVVAIFALSKSVLVLSSDDQKYIYHDGLEIDEFIFSHKETYPALEIDYLAISNDWRNKGLGSFIINEISNKVAADKLSATMFITVEALEKPDYSSVGFYKKSYFKDSEHGIIRNQGRSFRGEPCDTRRMYRIVYNN